jgi:hypothetical protein
VDKSKTKNACGALESENQLSKYPFDQGGLVDKPSRWTWEEDIREQMARGGLQRMQYVPKEDNGGT